MKDSDKYSWDFRIQSSNFNDVLKNLNINLKLAQVQTEKLRNLTAAYSNQIREVSAIASSQISILESNTINLIKVTGAFRSTFSDLISASSLLRIQVLGIVTAASFGLYELIKLMYKASGFEQRDLSDPEVQKEMDEITLRKRAEKELTDEMKRRGEIIKRNKLKLPVFDEEDVKLKMGEIKQRELGLLKTREQYNLEKELADITVTKFNVPNFEIFNLNLTEENETLADKINIISNEIRLKELLHTLDELSLIDSINKLKNYDDENLMIEDRITLLEKQAELEEKLRENFSPAFRKALGGDTPPLANFAIQHKEKGNAKDINPRQKEIEEQEEETRLEQEKLGYAQGMWSNFQAMLNATGLMKGQFGEIINMINSIISAATSGAGFVSSIIGLIGSFIPGGGLATGVINGITSGGGGLSFGPPKLPNVNNIPRVNSGRTVIVQNIIKNPVTFRKALDIETRTINNAMAAKAA